MIKIEIHYFASLRDDRGCESEVLTVEREITPEAVYRRLQREHGFRLPNDALRVAVNHEFSDWKTELKEGDELVFLPPMAGG